MRYFAFASVIAGLMALLFSLVYSQPAASQEAPYDWKSDWAVAEGFTMTIDSEGYSLPTAIAFVPNPGPEPKDPLYFVTELRGKVKVVTNDRSVYTFAENFFQLKIERELPAGKGENGLAGICLDPAHGYVFVTFAYQDEEGVLRNNIARFQAKPETFSLEPSDQIAFTEVFAAFRSGYAHQIGPCQVQDETLYVSVGEAWQSNLAQQIDAMIGKVIRMTLDGKPVPDNPFYEDDDPKKTAN
ncbi:MAG TPA: PQQ-dependent sugar dehydrogenase, partial [Anaerolineae bacterium]|nr:PQQ-dependent sugar dehydrogenase [Anaerolineae bacterium]